MPSTGRCFDIGSTTAGALSRFQSSDDPFAGATDPHSAGNGSLMRLAPVPLFFANQPAEAVERSGESSKTTHGTQAAVDACRCFAGLLVGAVGGASKEALLSPCFSPVPDYWKEHPLHPEIATVADGFFKVKDPPQIKGTGYVVRSLEAALWAFHRTDSFREAVLAAANLGDDADTTAAICGQIAGAYYGVNGIPDSWRNRVAKQDLILSLADQLYTFGSSGSLTLNGS